MRPLNLRFNNFHVYLVSAVTVLVGLLTLLSARQGLRWSIQRWASFHWALTATAIASRIFAYHSLASKL
jgi:hypothetical protein